MTVRTFYLFLFFWLEKWWLEARGAIHHLWIRAAGASSSCPSRMEAAFNKTVIQSEKIQSFLFLSPRWKTKIKQSRVNQTSPDSVSFAVNMTDLNWLIRSISKSNHVRTFLFLFFFKSHFYQHIFIMLFWYFYLLRYISWLILYIIFALGPFVSVKAVVHGPHVAQHKKKCGRFLCFLFFFFSLQVVYFWVDVWTSCMLSLIIPGNEDSVVYIYKIFLQNIPAD